MLSHPSPSPCWPAPIVLVPLSCSIVLLHCLVPLSCSIVLLHCLAPLSCSIVLLHCLGPNTVRHSSPVSRTAGASTATGRSAQFRIADAETKKGASTPCATRRAAPMPKRSTSPSPSRAKRAPPADDAAFWRSIKLYGVTVTAVAGVVAPFACAHSSASHTTAASSSPQPQLK